MPAGGLYITSFFLLLLCARSLFYVAERYGYSFSWLPVRPLFVGGAFALVFLLTGKLLLLLGAEHVLLAFSLATALVLSFLHPVVAVSFLGAFLFLRPWEYFPPAHELTSLPRGAALVALASLVIFQIRTRQMRFMVNAPVITFCALLVWLFLAAFFSPTPDESLELFFGNFFPITVVGLLILHAAADELDLKMLLDALLLALSGVILAALWFTADDALRFGVLTRLRGGVLWGNSNDLAALIVLVLPFAVGPFLSAVRERSFPWWRSAALLVFLLGLALSQSRGGLLALAAGGAAYWFFCRGRARASSLLVAAFFFLLPLIMFLFISRGEADLSGSSSARLNYAIAGVRMAAHHPVFGVGLGNYPAYYEQYTPAFFEWGQRTAHSSWILILAEAGLVGLFAFTLLYLLILRRAWKFRREKPEYFVALISYGVAMSFLSHTYLLSPYILFALIVAATRESTVREERETVKAHLHVAVLCVAALVFLPRSALAEKNVVSVTAGLEKPQENHLPEVFSSLTLFGAPGETIPFTLRFSGAQCWPSPKLRWERFPPKMSRPQAAFFRAATVEVKQRSFPTAQLGKHLDPLLPFPPSEVCFQDKDALGNSWWGVGEISLPRELSAGTYLAKLHFGKKEKLSVKLIVWPFHLPDRPALPAYAELTPWFNLLGHYGKWHEGEGALAREYIAEMLAHRIAPLKAVVANPPAKGASLDLQHPNPSDSYERVMLYQRPRWALTDFPTVKQGEIGSPASQEYLRAVEGTAQQLSGKYQSMFYLWDEPKEKHFPSLIRLARDVRRLAPSVKVMVTTPYRKSLHSLVDIFCPVMDEFDVPGRPRPLKYQELQQQGKEVWWYVSCMSHGCDALMDSKRPDFVIERPAAAIRSISWLSMKYGLDAFLYYSVNNGYQMFPERDPWVSLWDFSGNGDGTLFYPGRPGERGLNRHQPITSWRLKLWREASYDADYIELMEQQEEKPAWWQQEWQKIVPNTKEWSRSYVAYRKLRRRIGEYLSSERQTKGEL